MRPGDILFESQLNLERFAGEDGPRDKELAKSKVLSDKAVAIINRAVKENSALYKEFGEKGGQVIIELPKPMMNVPIFRCTKWFNRYNPVCSSGTTADRIEMDEYRAPIVNALLPQLAGMKNAIYYNTFDVLCHGERCPGIEDGKPYFFDADHITLYSNMLIYEDFASKFLN
jgi:hypothetical protein